MEPCTSNDGPLGDLADSGYYVGLMAVTPAVFFFFAYWAWLGMEFYRNN